MDRSISDIIYRSFIGKLSAGEQDALSEWLAMPENRALYDRIRDKETILRKAERFDRYDAEGAWRRIDRNIGRRRSVRPWRYVAAVLVPLLAIGGGYLWYEGSRTRLGVGGSVIEPGGQIAQVVLPEGDVLNLYRDSSYRFTTSEGLEVRSENGEVSFGLQGAGQAVSQKSSHTVRTPRGAEFKVILPDGSVAWLNAESSLVFPSRFDDAARKVQITGEVYFDVTRGDTPFIVETAGISVRVLGTEFNVRAYEDDDIATTLVEGSVMLGAGGSEVRLSPGQQATLNAAGSFDVRDVDVNGFTAWKRGYFYFDGMALEDIMEELGRWYDVTTYFADDAVKKERFSLEIRRQEDFTNVLKLLQHTGTVAITTKDHEVFIKK